MMTKIEVVVVLMIQPQELMNQFMMSFWMKG